jgi:hypothetical protein
MTIVAKCDCKRMMRVIKRLGGTHSEKDVLNHFDDEERFVFPRLPRAVAMRLYQDHQRLRHQLQTRGKVDPADFARHARAEDEIAAQYFPDW